MIELDLSSPWEPPEPPRAPLRFRLRSRWMAALTVLAVAAVVLTAAGAKPRTGPLYHLADQVRNVIVDGDMLFVGRFQQSAAGQGIEGRRLSDGKVLWRFATELQDQYVALSDHALILIRHANLDRGYTTTLTAVDKATGRQLWTRPQTSLIGTGGGLVAVEDMPEPGKVIEIPAGEEPPDLTVNDAGDPQARHILALDERTGATAWEFTAPPGTVLDVNWDGRYPAGHVTGIDQLDPTGLVSRRDVRTGAVTSTHQLDWSGLPASFSTGASWVAGPVRTPARALVYPDGERGGLVFDLDTGRRLFRTDVAIYDGFYQCGTDLFCTGTDRTISGYDGTTGRFLWRIDGYSQVVVTDGARLVVTTYEQPDATERRLGVVDARTGDLTTELTDWRLIESASSQRILVWRAVDTRTALLGELNPATGRIAVFGRAGDWYGPPECSAAGDILACVMVGEATVWRLPARHSSR